MAANAKNLDGDRAIALCLGILTSLTASRTGAVELDALCTELDASKEGIDEALSLLQSIADERSGARIAIARLGGTLSLMGDAGRLAPLRLTEPEANALSQALKRCKLDGDVRARISRALDPVQTSGHADRLLAGDALFGGFFPIIAEAISIGARMRMRYRTAGQSSPSERTIDPGFIEVSGDAAYLAAWDVEKDEQRSYRLDRIDDVVLTDDSVIDHPFARRSTAESLRDHGDTALIRWSSQRAFDSCTWAGLDRDRARTLEDGGVEAPVSYTSEAWLFDQILAAGGRIVIASPPELRDRLIAYAR